MMRIWSFLNVNLVVAMPPLLILPIQKYLVLWMSALRLVKSLGVCQRRHLGLIERKVMFGDVCYILAFVPFEFHTYDYTYYCMSWQEIGVIGSLH